MQITDELKILIVESEQLVLDAFEKYILRIAPNSRIYKTKTGNDAWKIADKSHIDLVLINTNITPTFGLELCSSIKTYSHTSSIYCIVVAASPTSTPEIRTQAFKAGADDFIGKPFTIDDLNARLKVGLRAAALQRQILNQKTQKESEDEELLEIANLAADLLQSRFPTLITMFERVESISLWIAKHFIDLGKSDLQNIGLASKFCYLGRLLLPESLQLQPVMQEGQVVHSALKQISSSAAAILNKARLLKEAGVLLESLYENFDGSGFPQGKKAWQLPLGSRILRVVLDYEELSIFLPKGAKGASDSLFNGMNHLYDPRVVLLHEEYRANEDGTLRSSKVTTIELKDVQQGMTLFRDLYANSGLKLLSAGVVFSQEVINQITNHHARDPILGNIYVYK